MAEPLSDFSRIVELQEIRKLYDDLQERHRQEIEDRDSEIGRLRAEITSRSGAGPAGDDVQALKAENERLTRQIQLVRQDYEAKIERLSARVRELSAGTPAAAAPNGEGDRKGFFRR